MEPTPQPPTQPTTPVITSTASRGIFGTKIPSTVAFAVGVLLFFLPFAEIKCRGTVIGKNSGFGIAIGKKWESVSSKSLFDNGNNDADNKEESAVSKKQDPNVYAIVAWALGILGLLLSFSNARSAVGAAIVTGILSAGALIGLMLDLQKQVKGETANAPKDNSADIFGLGKLGDMTMKIDFTPWFYIAVIAFLAAAFFSYLRIASKKT